MLEKVLDSLNSFSVLAGVGRRELAALFLVLSGLGCKTLSCQSDYVFDPAEKRELAAILNDATSTDKYVGAISTWPKEEKIWPVLEQKAARERFASFVIAKDIIGHEDYLYDKPDDPHYQPCLVENFNGPDDPGLKKCEAKRLNSIDVKNPMTCGHFTRKIFWTYGKAGQEPPFTPPHNRYEIPVVAKKYFMPLREIEIIRPQDLRFSKNEQPRPHAVAAVWLQGQAIDSVSKEEFNRPENWYFFEPQRDSRLFVAPSNQGLIPGYVILIHPDHDLPLDSVTESAINSNNNQQYESALAFAVNKNLALVPAQFLGSRNLTQLVYERAANPENFSQIMDQFYEINQSPDINNASGLLELTLSAIAASGNFTDLEVANLSAWSDYLRHPAIIPLPEKTKSIVKDFLIHREDYFSRTSSSSSFSSLPSFGYLEFQKAFQSMELSGLLLPKEIQLYKFAF